MDGLDDEQAEDDKFLRAVREPTAAATITLAHPARVDTMYETLKANGSLTFEKVCAEPLGAYTLGAFMDGVADLLAPPPAGMAQKSPTSPFAILPAAAAAEHFFSVARTRLHCVHTQTTAGARILMPC